MCLFTKWRENEWNEDLIKTTEEDKIVYKRLERKGEGYLTPYRKFFVTTGATMETDNFSMKKLYNTFYHIEEWVIEEGIHCYEEWDACNNWLCPTEVIVQCTIPKGTQFVRGDVTDIVCKKLIIGKEDPHNELQ